jgi:hypothetical protein
MAFNSGRTEDLSPVSFDNNALKIASREILLETVREVIGSDAGKRYFTEVNPSGIQIVDKMNVTGVDGWILRWPYKHGETKLVQNPDKTAKVSVFPAVVSDGGIIFELFISFKLGHALVYSTRSFRISNPPMRVAYYVETKNRDEELIKSLDDICSRSQERLSAFLSKSAKSSDK